MDLRRGDRVLVNVAPFIGSVRPHRESIPCTVLCADGSGVEVATEYPYRELSLWVPWKWIEAPVEHAPGSPAGEAEPGDGSGRRSRSLAGA